MKDDWRATVIAEACPISNRKVTQFRGELPYYSTGSVGSEGKLSEPEMVTFTKRPSRAGCRPKVGDVGFARMKGTKKVILINEKLQDAIFSTGFCFLVPGQGLSPRFLFYLVTSEDFQDTKNELAGSGIMGGIKNADAEQIRVPMPPLAEQERIVAILDEAFESVAAMQIGAEKNLLGARDLFNNYLQSVFAHPGESWEQHTLEQVSTSFGRGKSKHRPRNEKKLYGGKYPFIQTGDIRNSNHFITEYTQTYSDAGLAQSKLWPKGTICITIAANIAETGILTFDACFPDSIIGMVVDPIKADIGFVEYLLQSYKTRLQALGKGSAQANINMGTFEHEKFPFPSVEAQRRIVSKLDALSAEVQRLESIYQHKLFLLDEFKKELLRKAFAGELIKAGAPVRSAVQGAVPSPYVRNQVHAAIIDQTTKDGGWTTEVAVAKYDHLLQEVYGLSLGYQFAQHQFGPFDAQIKRLIASGLGRNKWFTKKNGMIVYGANVGGLLSRQSNLYQAARSKMQELSALGVTKLDADKVELLSTVCHSIKETGSTSLNKIRDFMSQWPTDSSRMKADKFSLEQTQKCLDFILNNNLHKAVLK